MWANNETGWVLSQYEMSSMYELFYELIWGDLNKLYHIQA